VKITCWQEQKKTNLKRYQRKERGLRTVGNLGNRELGKSTKDGPVAIVR